MQKDTAGHDLWHSSGKTDETAVAERLHEL